MSEPFMGQIMQVGFNFAPRGWASCNGQILGIAQNNALFALLGTTFGGNGVSTFALPNAAGRGFVGLGQSTAGGQTYVWGQAAGTETETLTIANMPAHNHVATFTGIPGQTTATGSIQAISDVTTGQSNTPAAGSMFSNCANAGTNQVKIYVPSGTTGTSVNLGGVNITGGNFTPQGSVQVGITGSNIPFSIMNPYVAVQTNIALAGVFPSRN
ncbi:microcystin-dependent protein [Sphingomonas kyeonggiensis]|uniref:Microcystin-dependent protein n=1 Tax=Sphingomonas kyeonggiensis TaxID=1268553 RepID=A0A7W7K5E4_9SPHN|nr:tail fiber protein [Sphingomonas kyeonggiensis]MBB4840735.1 microcystin-dependent protein [Sphingomonas kyeonggiensis]